MIGGTDIILPVRDTLSAMQLALRAAVALWRRPVFEDADTGETFPEYRQLDLAGRPEILVYRDAAAYSGWKELGGDESLDGTMIHLIARSGELTIAVDDVPSATICGLVDAIRSALRKDLFASRAEVKPPKEAA